jgi:hypothetical protein
MAAPLTHFQKRAIFLVFLIISTSLGTITSTASQTSKTTIVWSDSVFLEDGFNVEVGQILIVQPGTNIVLGDEEKIIVDGRINIQGTISSPVTLDANSGNHHGIVFNATSNGHNSAIDNLTINDAKYGVTIYGSNPIISNLLVVNADSVAVDLFDGASPTIKNLTIEGGGQDVHGFSSSWRYGIGLSIGFESAPIVEGVKIDGLITRGLNFWGKAGGLFTDINISNISGATLSVSAGIWVEDSIPLLKDIDINRCDNGVFVRHQTEGWTTRPTFSEIVIENSQYRGIMVERYNHSQYSNLLTNAVFEELQLRGTGGPNAKTSGLGYAAFDINTSGVHVDGALIEDNIAVGLRAYMIDSSTKIENATFINNGQTSSSVPINDRAGLFFRSASWSSKGPAIVNNLIVNNSIGPGVLMMKGGVIGSNWFTSENGGNGVDFREFHPRVDTIISINNSLNGLYVFDSSNVELSEVATSQNGIGQTIPEDGSGIFFHESNTVMSGGKNVSCNSCSSTNDQYGISIKNSIDLQLKSVLIKDTISPIPLNINNSEINYFGNIILDDITIFSNSSDYALKMVEVDAKINNLQIMGFNDGLYWSGKGITSSSIDTSIIYGSNNACFDLSDHAELVIANTSIYCSSNNPTSENSIVSFTDTFLLQNSSMQNSFILGDNNHIKWISSQDILTPISSFENNIFDIMWNLEIHTVNQYFMNIPYAEVNISFDIYEENLTTTQPYSGNYLYGPFIGKRWLPQEGWSSDNIVNSSCSYDGIYNSTDSLILTSDTLIVCRLDISNQAPFIIWQLPEDDSQYSSASVVIFDASNSWDLDLDEITFTWTSNLDGDFTYSCTQEENIANYSHIIANNESQCLSDGVHQITLEVCDIENQCVNESRRIELINLPPILSVGTVPKINSIGILYLGETANISIILDGTYDPENGDLWCWLETSYEDPISVTDGNPNCPDEISRSFIGAPGQFNITVFASDGINPSRSWAFNVVLVNELPSATMQISRIDNISSSLVRLDGTETTDPEGDIVKFEFISSIDGLLFSGLESTNTIEWLGYLSKGIHNITMKASDDLPNHAGLWTYYSFELEVLNSPPVALISQPNNGIIVESGDILDFQSTGSGDWDLACSDLIDNGSNLLCNPYLGGNNDLVSILWISDELSEPIGTDWTFQSRLPSGNHNITLSLDDGNQKVMSPPINIIITKSAPIMILDSPIPDIEVNSNSAVLFDFQNSFDPDGDLFTVSIESDLSGIILENKTTDYSYNEYLSAGEHNLTITLFDSDKMERKYNQKISILESAPIANINNLENGQYISPGESVDLNASSSFDYDDDIILYQWSLNDGTIISDKEQDLVYFNPGSVQINLLVQDSRGAQDFTSINLTIGSSYPKLENLVISIDSIEMNVPTEVYIYVNLYDPDRTTNQVKGEMLSGGVSEVMIFRDDGKGSDQVADDNVWTYRSNWDIVEGNWVKVEIWAVDGELVSQSQIESIPVVDQSDENTLDWLFSAGFPLLIILIIIFSLLGVVYANKRRIQIARDIELIESWSAFVPRELDEEFDNKED